MRVLLDACVPKGLRRSLSGHEVRTAPEMGWGDLDNGDLLDAMKGIFDVLVTVDRRLPQQRRIEDRPLGVVVLPQGRTASRTFSLWFRIFSPRFRPCNPARSKRWLINCAICG